MDRGVWQTTVYRVSKFLSQTRLKRLGTHTKSTCDWDSQRVTAYSRGSFFRIHPAILNWRELGVVCLALCSYEPQGSPKIPHFLKAQIITKGMIWVAGFMVRSVSIQAKGGTVHPRFIPVSPLQQVTVRWFHFWRYEGRERWNALVTIIKSTNN